MCRQLVLEVLEGNVRRGSSIYEKDHVLVLGWCDNRRDEEVMWKILSQASGLQPPNMHDVPRS